MYDAEYSQKTRDIEPYYWDNVADNGLKLIQHWLNVSYLYIEHLQRLLARCRDRFPEHQCPHNVYIYRVPHE